MIYTLLISLMTLVLPANQDTPPKDISKNGMEVSWRYEGDRIHFTMSANTSGWVTIGFNQGSGTTGAYLLMGRVVNGKAEVVEFYTKSPGSYRPITEYGQTAQVLEVSGEETNKGTLLKFSIPTAKSSEYARDLHQGKAYTLIMAYSRSDDFQHHSMMRTSELVKL